MMSCLSFLSLLLLGLTLSTKADSLTKRSVDLDYHECHDPNDGKLQWWIQPGVEYWIRSPNYPELYPSKELCTFEFSTDTDCDKFVSFECDDFDIQPSTGCEKDYLLFISDENAKEGEKICNSNFNKSDSRGFYFQNEFGIRFRTGKWKNLRGFSCKLVFSETSNNCQPETTTISEWDGENTTEFEDGLEHISCQEDGITFAEPNTMYYLDAPSNPERYNHSECCGYQFEVDGYQHAQFWCENFDIGSDQYGGNGSSMGGVISALRSTVCESDYVEFTIDSEFEKERICNSNFNYGWREFSVNNYLGIHLKSNELVTSDDFGCYLYFYSNDFETTTSYGSWGNNSGGWNGNGSWGNNTGGWYGNGSWGNNGTNSTGGWNGNGSWGNNGTDNWYGNGSWGNNGSDNWYHETTDNWYDVTTDNWYDETTNDWYDETTDDWYDETSTDDWYETSTDDWYETSTDDWYETSTDDWYETSTNDWYETSTDDWYGQNYVECRESGITIAKPYTSYFLNSPNYPMRYNNSECCGYQFRVDQTMNAYIWCQDFDLPSDQYCTNNYLDFTIDSGNGKEKICNSNFKAYDSHRFFNEINSFIGFHFQSKSDQDFITGSFSCEVYFYPAYPDYSDYSGYYAAN